MVQYILAIACAVMQPPKQLDDFGEIPCRPVSITARSPSCLIVASTSRRAFSTISLNPCGMDTPVRNQPFKRNPCDFPAYRVKAGQSNCFRCVVNYQIYTGQRFDCSDVAAFAPDNTLLHLIVRERH